MNKLRLNSCIDNQYSSPAVHILNLRMRLTVDCTRGAITNAGSWMYTSGTMPLTNWAHPENSTIEMLIKRLKLHTLLSYLVSMYENFEHSQPK